MRWTSRSDVCYWGVGRGAVGKMRGQSGRTEDSLRVKGRAGVVWKGQKNERGGEVEKGQAT